MTTYEATMIAFSCGMAAQLFVLSKFIRRLKHRYPAEWEKLEEARFKKPMQFIDPLYFTYFLTRRYRALDDIVLTRFGDCSLALSVLLTALFVSFCLGF